MPGLQPRPSSIVVHWSPTTRGTFRASTNWKSSRLLFEPYELLGRPAQPQHHRHPRPIRRQHARPHLIAVRIAHVVADGRLGVSDFAAGAGVETGDAAGFP